MVYQLSKSVSKMSFSGMGRYAPSAREVMALRSSAGNSARAPVPYAGIATSAAMSAAEAFWTSEAPWVIAAGAADAAAAGAVWDMIVADGVNKGRWPGQVLPPGWSPIGGEGQDGVTRFFVYYAEGFYFYRPEQLWRFQGNRNYWVSFTVEPNLKWGEYRHVSYGTNTEQMDLVRELHVPAMPGCYLDFGSAPGLIPPTEWEELWSEANETALEPAVSLEVALYPGAGHRLAVDTVISADPPQRPPSETKEKEGKYFGKRGIFAIYRIAENGGDFMQIAAAFHQAARARMMKEHHTKVPPWSQQSWAERIRMIEWGLTNGVDWSDFGTKVAKWALYEKIGAILYPSIGQFGPGDRMSGDFRTFNLHQQSGLLANI